MATKTIIAIPDEVTTGTTTDDTLVLPIENYELVNGRRVTIKVTAGTIKFNTQGDADDSNASFTVDDVFETVIHRKNQIKFKANATTDKFIIS